MKKLFITAGIILGVFAAVIYSYEGIGYAPDKGQITGNSTVGGNLSVNGTGTFGGDATIGDDLTVTGGATVDDELTVTGCFTVVDGSGVVVGASTAGFTTLDGVGDLGVAGEFEAIGNASFYSGIKVSAHLGMYCDTDDNTGYYFPATDYIRIIAGGAIAMDYDQDTHILNLGNTNTHNTIKGVQTIISADGTYDNREVEVTTSSMTVNVPITCTSSIGISGYLAFVDTGTTPSGVRQYGATAQGIVYIATATVDANSWQKVADQ